MFYIFALFSAFINNKSLYEAFGFHGEYPIIVGFLLFSDALSPMDAVVKLLMNILIRKFEFEAGMWIYSSVAGGYPSFSGVDWRLDAFAVNLGYSVELARSLLKLQKQNLSTMDADWMYASYHYSHPILPERLARLGWGGSRANGEKAADSEKPVKAADREL
jgi:STE24 endopeptidase